ncbi:MAG: type 4a pilus biogenesis protein PilO [Acidobacteria bacterium]|nr:type 4a pilus biogenesis protein PilO [Acidobacteriota bacterium]
MEWEDLSFPAQLGIVAGFAVAILAAFYFLYVSSTMEQIDKTKDQIRQLVTKIDEGKRTSARLNEFKQEVQKLEDKFAVFKEIIPEKIEYDELLKYFDTIASETSIVIISQHPQKLVPMGFYAEYPIKVRMIGGYHNLVNFFLRIKNLKRIINVSGMKLKQRKNETGDINKMIDIDFTATTFVFIPESQRVSTVKKGKKGGAKRGGH